MSPEFIIAGPFETAGPFVTAIESIAPQSVVAVVPNLENAKAWLSAPNPRRILILLDPSANAGELGEHQSILCIRRSLIGEVEVHGLHSRQIPARMRPLATKLAKAIATVVGPPADVDPLTALGFTQRERQVLEMLCSASSNARIARELGLSAGTVKNYLTRIFGRLDVRSRSEALLKSIELSLKHNSPIRRVAVAAWIRDGRGRVLLHKEKSGGWGLPGGRVEVGETVEAAVRREVKEETALDVTLGRLIGVYSNPQEQRHTDGRQTFEYVTVYAQAHPISSAPVPGRNARFFDVEALGSLPMASLSPHWLEDSLRGSEAPVWR